MLKDKIQLDLTESLKTKDSVKLETLRYIMAEIKNKEIDSADALTDDEILAVIKKQVKQLQEANTMFEKGSRQDLIDGNLVQIGIMQAYLPAQLSADDVSKEVDRIMGENAGALAANPKAIIGICMRELSSKADPADIMQALRAKGVS